MTGGGREGGVLGDDGRATEPLITRSSEHPLPDYQPANRINC